MSLALVSFWALRTNLQVPVPYTNGTWNFVMNILADALAPSGARSSSVLIPKLLAVNPVLLGATNPKI